MLNPNVIKLRGTIFLPKTIGYSSANELKYRGLLPNSVAASITPPTIQISPAGLQVIQDSKLEEGGSWQLLAGDTHVVFSQVKVDIIRDVVAPLNSVEIDFCAFCSRLFRIILKEEGLQANRLAFAPLYAKDRDDNFQSKLLWHDQLSHSTYENVDIEEVSLTYNYRVEKKIIGQKRTINFKTIISDAQKQLPSGVIIQGCVTISLDINTAVDQNQLVVFTEAEVEEFFNKVPSWNLDFIRNNIDA